MSLQLAPSAQYNVAIVGATGGLGKEVAKAFLTHYRPYFASIVAVVRDASTVAARALAEQGAELRQVNSAEPVVSFAEAFKGVDAVVNIANAAASVDYHNAIFEAALNSGVKVYFPSEFGSDLRWNDFPGWDDVSWVQKREHLSYVRQLSGGKVKIVAVSTGMFLEGSLGPWLGFDTANMTYTVVGSPDTKIALTAKLDIGRALAELSLLSLSPESASRVPDHVRIAGNNKSYREVRDIVQNVRKVLGVPSDGEIVLKTEDYEKFKALVREEQLKSPSPHPLRHLMLLSAEGKMDFSTNDNDLVNPGQKVWKWKFVTDYIQEVGGKPFC